MSFWLASWSPTATRKAKVLPGWWSGPGARSSISELLGFGGWLGTLPSTHTLKVATNEATKKEGVKEVVAKDLKVFPLIFGLHVSGDIVNQSLKRKINLTAIVVCILPVWKVRGIYYLGYESTNRRVLFVAL